MNADIKSRTEQIAGLNTATLARELTDYGDTYTLMAQFEADHRRLIAALDAIEAECAATDTESSEALQSDLVGRIHAAISKTLDGSAK